MAQIDKWKCDICEKAFEENDAGYANRRPLYIEIDRELFEGKETIGYDDVCGECRNKIYYAIDQSIADLMK